MIALVQRVSEAEVTVGGESVGAIRARIPAPIAPTDSPPTVTAASDTRCTSAITR